MLGLVLAGSGAHAQPRPDVPPTPPRVVAEPVNDPVAIGEWLRTLAGSFDVDGQVEVRMRATREVEQEDPYEEESEEESQPPSFADLLLREMRTESGYDDVIESTGASGSGDCVGIGTGPGVQCIFQITWPDMLETVQPSELERGGVFTVPGGVSNLAPSMAVFGLEPTSSRLRYLLVDSAGIAEGASGRLVGDTATFRTPCANTIAIIDAMRPPPVRQPGEPPPPPPPSTCTRIIRVVANPESSAVRLLVDIELDGRRKTSYSLALRRPAQPTDEQGP